MYHSTTGYTKLELSVFGEAGTGGKKCVREDYSIMQGEDKAGLWKRPYHNGRACMEILKRIGEE